MLLFSSALAGSEKTRQSAFARSVFKGENDFDTASKIVCRGGNSIFFFDRFLFLNTNFAEILGFTSSYSANNSTFGRRHMVRSAAELCAGEVGTVPSRAE
jgi:hypothetical protein